MELKTMAGVDISEHTRVEVFSNAVVVVDETYLNEVPEDKLSFFNRVGAIAEVNIICNSKGSFTARGSWKKIIALEEILKQSLSSWRCDAAKRISCSERDYISEDCAITDETRQRQNNLNESSDASIQEKSNLETFSTFLRRANSRANTEVISSPISNEVHSVIPTAADGFHKVEGKENNGNEIYVNITLSTNNPMSLTSDEPCLTSEKPSISNVESVRDTKVKQSKVSRFSEGAMKKADDLFSKHLSEKDKRKLYEQQTPFKFFCTLCSFKSKRESHYKKHLQLHKQGTTKLFVCTQCGFRTIRLGHLRRHELQHASQALRCPHCPYTTDSATFLLRHQRIKHTSNAKQASNEENLLHCAHCNYMTSQPHFLKRHLKVHGIGEYTNRNLNLSYQCEKCSYKTRRKEHFERHRRDVHSEARPFLCDACGKAFKRADALRQHRAARHHPLIANEGNIISDANSATSQYSLYCCPECSKPCRSRAHMRDHMATHSDERSFLCEVCGSSFKTRAVQRKHIATVHANPKAFPCNRCVRRFSTKYALLRHLKIHGLAKEDNARPTTKAESIALNCIGVSRPKAGSMEDSSIESSEILMQARQEVVSKKELSRETEGMEVGLEAQRQPSSSVQTSSEVVTVMQGIQETKGAGGSDMAMEIDGEMHSVIGGALTRTPAQSETTTALLYLTTDFMQY